MMIFFCRILLLSISRFKSIKGRMPHGWNCAFTGPTWVADVSDEQVSQCDLLGRGKVQRPTSARLQRRHPRPNADISSLMRKHGLPSSRRFNLTPQASASNRVITVFGMNSNQQPSTPTRPAALHLCVQNRASSI